jgi:hypothetical protein
VCDGCTASPDVPPICLYVMGLLKVARRASVHPMHTRTRGVCMPCLYLRPAEAASLSIQVFDFHPRPLQRGTNRWRGFTNHGSSHGLSRGSRPNIETRCSSTNGNFDVSYKHGVLCIRYMISSHSAQSKLVCSGYAISMVWPRVTHAIRRPTKGSNLRGVPVWRPRGASTTAP